MSEEKITKVVMSPRITISHNDKDEGYVIEVELPGVKKEDIELFFWSKGFCIDGKKEDIIYSECYNLAHEVRTEEAKAKFENGLLTIIVPFKEKLRAKKVKVE